MARLERAIDAGLLVDDAKILICHPEPEFDMAGITGGHVVHPFKPVHDNWSKRGFSVSTTLPSGNFDLAIVCATRSKQQTRDLIAQAMTRAKTVVVDGQKTDGIESLFKDLRKQGDVIGNITKAHGRIFWITATPMPDWIAQPNTVDGFETRAGVFSAGEIDPASRLLAQALPDDLSGAVADLGAGWGYLSSAILRHEKVTSLDLVEADHIALTCAQHNITDPRAKFHWADATTFKGVWDRVVMNPPFHMGKTASPALGQAFIAAAARGLRARGELWMVANRHLPYEAALSEKFQTVAEVSGSGAFKLFHACRPKR